MLHGGDNFEGAVSGCGGDGGAAGALLLATGPGEAVDADALTSGACGVVAIQAVGVLEGDDLKAEAPAADFEYGVAEIEAELVHGTRLTRTPTGRSCIARRPTPPPSGRAE